MPSVSPRQHRYFGYLESHPEARPKSLSASQVSEWLHADKGRHFAGGGAANNVAPPIDEVGDAQSRNIAETIHSGGMGPPTPMQAQPGSNVISMLDRARQAGARGIQTHAGGGHVRPHFDFGGMANPPYFARQEARGEDQPIAGFMHSSVPGRTDQLPVTPAAGSYVLPADVVSGLGEGNSLAGARLLDAMFHSMPYGARPPTPRGGGGVRMPRGEERLPSDIMPQMSYGGVAPGFAPGGSLAFMRPPSGQPGFAPMNKGITGPAIQPRKVPIVAAGGEMIIPPDVVKNHPLLGNGNLDHGHRVLDAFVKHIRKKTINEMKKLPGPKR